MRYYLLILTSKTVVSKKDPYALFEILPEENISKKNHIFFNFKCTYIKTGTAAINASSELEW